MSRARRWPLAAMMTGAALLLTVFGIATPSFASSATEWNYANQGSGIKTGANCLAYSTTSDAVIVRNFGSGSSGGTSACFTSGGDDSKDWYYTYTSSTHLYTFHSAIKGGCLDLNSSKNAVLIGCDGKTSQEWTLTYESDTSYFTMKNKGDDLCLGVGSSSGVVEARTCTTTSYQIWRSYGF